MSHRLVSPLLFLAVGLATLVLEGSPTYAADLDPGYADIPAIQENKVEFGSGWYIRGDIGATRLPGINLATPSLPTSTNFFPPAAPTMSVGQTSSLGYVASLGGGYQINKWFRTDVIFDFHQPVSTASVSGNANVFCPTGVSYPNEVINLNGSIDYGSPVYANGGCTGTYKANLKSYDALVNGYIDLGTWHNVTPYIGAGVGMNFGHYQSSSTYIQVNNLSYNISYTDPKYATTFYQNYDRSSSGTYYNLAWALMAGFSIDVYDHTKLDIGYRYLNLGSIPNISGNITTQEVRAGLRYMVDN